MLQAASIGVGLLGKEGQVASKFSDIALTDFKSVHRLLFMHGLFGSRMLKFLGVILFKGQLFAAILLFANTLNGYSGV